MRDGSVPLGIVSALAVASSVTVAFIWLEAIVDLVASSVGPRIPVNMSKGVGSAVCCCWCSDCSGPGEPIPGPPIDWYNRTIIQLISRRLYLNDVTACSLVLAGPCWRSQSKEVPWGVP
jgi:hypothetical protein